MKWAYNPGLKPLASELRRKMTMGEAVLWRHLKGGQRQGLDFHRQKPIDEFIVDFFCAKLALAIEIDGSTHNSKITEDEIRQKRLESLGISVLRFTENDVRSNVEGVVAAIDLWIEEKKGDKETPSVRSGHLPS